MLVAFFVVLFIPCCLGNIEISNSYIFYGDIVYFTNSYFGVCDDCFDSAEITIDEIKYNTYYLCDTIGMISCSIQTEKDSSTFYFYCVEGDFDITLDKNEVFSFDSNYNIISASDSVIFDANCFYVTTSGNFTLECEINQDGLIIQRTYYIAINSDDEIINNDSYADSDDCDSSTDSTDSGDNTEYYYDDSYSIEILNISFVENILKITYKTFYNEVEVLTQEVTDILLYLQYSTDTILEINVADISIILDSFPYYYVSFNNVDFDGAISILIKFVIDDYVIDFFTMML